MSKISKVEVFYIEQNPDNLTAAELAKELGRSVNTIKKFYKEKVIEEVVEAKKPSTPIDHLMGRRERNGQVVATVMTPGASEASDAARKEYSGRMGEAIKSAVHPCRKK